MNYEAVNFLYERGAHHYIRKKGEFAKLKKVILEALAMATVSASFLVLSISICGL